MKLVRIDGGKIGVLLQMAGEPHVVDIRKSLGMFANRDPLAGALIDGALKERCAWVDLVNGWPYLRRPLELLVHAALADPNDPQLFIYPFASVRPISPDGIVSIEITDAPEAEMYGSIERPTITRQLGDDRDAQPSPISVGDNVCVIDFRRRKEARTVRE